jgi:hypothetical protein
MLRNVRPSLCSGFCRQSRDRQDAALTTPTIRAVEKPPLARARGSERWRSSSRLVARRGHGHSLADAQRNGDRRNSGFSLVSGDIQDVKERGEAGRKSYLPPLSMASSVKKEARAPCR